MSRTGASEDAHAGLQQMDELVTILHERFCGLGVASSQDVLRLVGDPRDFLESERMTDLQSASRLVGLNV